MHVTLISPERAVFDGPALSVVVPAFDGLVGILPQHAPFMTLLGEGPLTVRKLGGETSQFQVAGGFLQVMEDTVRVVVERSE